MTEMGISTPKLTAIHEALSAGRECGLARDLYQEAIKELVEFLKVVDAASPIGEWLLEKQRVDHHTENDWWKCRWCGVGIDAGQPNHREVCKAVDLRNALADLQRVMQMHQPEKEGRTDAGN